MGRVTPNLKRRSYLLPPGCKDLIDVLRLKRKTKLAPKALAIHPISTEHVFVNGKIRAPEVRVCAEDGTVLGVYRLSDALELAQKRDLDLVLVNAKAEPP